MIVWASEIHAGQVVGRVGDGVAADGLAAAEVGEVGSDRALGLGAADGVAAGARLAHEHLLALGRRSRCRAAAASAAGGPPSGRSRPGVCDDDQEAHAGVLDAAELGALAPVGARRLGREAQHVVLAGDHVDLAGQLRHPEAVDHVVGVEPDLDRLAGREVDLVGRREPGVGIGDIPPPPLGDDLDPAGRSATAGAARRSRRPW